MKKTVLIFTIMLCLLFVGCTSRIHLDYGTYYCEELACYIKVYPEEIDVSGVSRVYVAQSGWFFDKSGNKQELSVYTNTGGYMCLARDVNKSNGIVEFDTWLYAYVQKCNSKQIVLNYRLVMDGVDIEIQALDKNNDKKFIFNRVDE